MNRHLKYYVTAVKHPDVSGFEHLEMLMIRDKLTVEEAELSTDELKLLLTADQQLLITAHKVHQALAEITDLQLERQNRQPSPKHWWWYLDVLKSLPAQPSDKKNPRNPRNYPQLSRETKWLSTNIAPASPNPLHKVHPKPCSMAPA